MQEIEHHSQLIHSDGVLCQPGSFERGNAPPDTLGQQIDNRFRLEVIPNVHPAIIFAFYSPLFTLIIPRRQNVATACRRAI